MSTSTTTPAAPNTPKPSAPVNPLSLEARKDAKKAIPKGQKLKAVLPDVWALVAPRKWLLVLGLVLMGINRVSGLVLPWSTKSVIDDVILGHHAEKLNRLLLMVICATVIQGVTAFTLTQLLSKEAQRLISEMRRKVQEHIGKLSLSFFDANKSGVLVSRIMSDVEGVRNLIGTGLIDFLGGLITATIALGVLIYISPVMTLVACVMTGLM